MKINLKDQPHIKHREFVSTDTLLRALRCFNWTTDAVSVLVDDYDNILVSCNVSDVFYWGTADVEPIDNDSIELLEEIRALSNAWDYDPTILYAATRRNMRPQGAWYHLLEDWEVDYLNARFPERKTDILNPKTEEVRDG